MSISSNINNPWNFGSPLADRLRKSIEQARQRPQAKPAVQGTVAVNETSTVGGKTQQGAPRITREHCEKLVANEQFYQFPGTTVTVCCLTLKNGYSVVGMSAAAHPTNYDWLAGRRMAREEAFGKISSLEAYLLREHLSGAVERFHSTIDLYFGGTKRG